MKASPGARSWIAAGVRHELLTRALPALRHDMSAPISVIRMGLLLLRRQSPSDAQERLAAIEEQLSALVGAIRSLRDWELALDDEQITRAALVSQCTDLMRAAFELNGVRLLVDEALAAAQDDARFPAPAALRYMVLGVLGHLNDGDAALGAIRLQAEGANALRFVAETGSVAPTDPMAGALRAPRKLAIDAVALQALADDLGYSVTVARGSVRLALTPGANA